jgi:hypothetical protein
MPSRNFHEPDMSNKEESNSMTHSRAAVGGIHDPERYEGDLSKKSVFVNGLCQSLKNVNQYRSGMIEKIKNQLGSHSIYFRKKQ